MLSLMVVVVLFNRELHGDKHLSPSSPVPTYMSPHPYSKESVSANVKTVS